MTRLNRTSTGMILTALTVAATGGGCGSTATNANTSQSQGFIDAKASQQLLSEARARFESGNLIETERTLELAAEANPFDGRLHYNLGVLALRQGRFDSAAKRFERASGLMPQAVEPQLGIASTLLQTGRYEAAADAFKRALELDPTSRTASEGLTIAMDCAAPDRASRSSR
ncbi:MAG: tetratricopeptide repeat protein [bacterium]|nr:tetratricopeptide repeat protein [bacterium]